LHRLFRGLLNATVHRGNHLRARARLALLDQAHGAAHRVDLDPLAAVLAAQILVEQPLETALADHLAASVPALFELIVTRLAAHLLGYVREASDDQLKQGRYRRGRTRAGV